MYIDRENSKEDRSAAILAAINDGARLKIHVPQNIDLDWTETFVKEKTLPVVNQFAESIANSRNQFRRRRDPFVFRAISVETNPESNVEVESLVVQINTETPADDYYFLIYKSARPQDREVDSPQKPWWRLRKNNKEQSVSADKQPFSLKTASFIQVPTIAAELRPKLPDDVKKSLGDGLGGWWYQYFIKPELAFGQINPFNRDKYRVKRVWEFIYDDKENLDALNYYAGVPEYVKIDHPADDFLIFEQNLYISPRLGVVNVNNRMYPASDLLFRAIFADRTPKIADSIERNLQRYSLRGDQLVRDRNDKFSISYLDFMLDFLAEVPLHVTLDKNPGAV